MPAIGRIANFSSLRKHRPKEFQIYDSYFGKELNLLPFWGCCVVCVCVCVFREALQINMQGPQSLDDEICRFFIIRNIEQSS